MRRMLLLASPLAWLVACGGGSSAPTTLPVDPDPNLAAPTEQPSVTPATPKHPWPATKRDDIADTVHGVKLADPYRWLEDEKAPDVQAWMKTQDDYARGELAKLPARGDYAKRLKELLYYDAVGVPVHRKGKFFFSRKHSDYQWLWLAV